MTAGVWLLLVIVAGLVLLLQLGSALGRIRGTLVGLGALLLLTGSWYVIVWPIRQHGPSGLERARLSVTSDSCFKCHESHYASWHRTYHRTMTREATPENVKGDFGDATYTYQGVTSRMTREGDTFYMETLDPVWAAHSAGRRQPPQLRKFKVDRLVGSHWFQECMHKDDAGRYWRMPVSYHIVEKRWIHTNGAFLAPDTDDFWSKSTVWNESCVFCHNTKPSKQPRRLWVARSGDHATTVGLTGYETEVAELGIACEACHGPGSEHVRVNHNPARRFAMQGSGDATIVNPRRLSVQRASEICAHCHGALAPRPEAWDPRTITDPFNAGEDLTRGYAFFWSEREQERLYAGRQPDPRKPLRPGPLDGRFWGDGTPLTTAVEYQGMALSACYERGQGQFSCLSCHSMHPREPNFMLTPRMETNAACYQCHDSYRQRLVEHTHHPASSSGSLCYNCHMPYQVYSLLTTHRSHRIDKLRIKDSLGTGKPHACNLCHLDKALGWTQDWLARWYGRTPESLSEEDRSYASALLHLWRSDARSRVVVAGAFSWPAAHEASGTDWVGPFLVRVLEKERYPAVRYLAYRALRSLYGLEVAGYDYLASPEERGVQLKRVRARLASRWRPPADKYPYLPLTSAGQPKEAVLEVLLRQRTDPDVFIHE